MKGLLLVVLILFLLSFLEFFYHLAFGWVLYLRQVIPQTQINGELLLSSLGALLLGMIGMQVLMNRLLARHQWRWRFTLIGCAMLILMFSTSVAAVGIVHQTGWLFRLPRWMEWSARYPQMTAVNNARQVLISARMYARDHDGRFPDTCSDMTRGNSRYQHIYWASMDQDTPPEPLVYAGAGMHDNDVGTLPVIWSAQTSASGKRMVGTLDGDCKIVPEAEFQAMLATLREHLAKQQH